MAFNSDPISTLSRVSGSRMGRDARHQPAIAAAARTIATMATMGHNRDGLGLAGSRAVGGSIRSGPESRSTGATKRYPFRPTVSM